MSEVTHPNDLRKTLDALDSESRLRRLKTITNPLRPQVELEGTRVLDFCNNDYLGLSQHPRLIEAAREATARYGVGTGGSRLIGGTLDLHTQLEAALARFKATEAALVFNSGYQANVGILSSLINRHDVVFADKLNHASLVDGALLSRGKVVRYPHLDLEALEKHLRNTPGGKRKFIVTDTVFSMDGDLAPLSALSELADRYQAWLILDEAHGTGVFGPHHRSGLWEETGLGPKANVIQMGTFSKALGGFGAYVAASRDVIQTLIQFSRSFIYSTSLPPGVIASNLAAIELVQENGDLTQALWDNIRYFESQARQLGLDIMLSSPIIPIIVGDDSKTMRFTQALLDAGFYCQGIRPPTVPQGTSRLRLTLSALHQHQQIDQLLACLLPLLG